MRLNSPQVRGHGKIDADLQPGDARVFESGGEVGRENGMLFMLMVCGFSGFWGYVCFRGPTFLVTRFSSPQSACHRLI